MSNFRKITLTIDMTLEGCSENTFEKMPSNIRDMIIDGFINKAYGDLDFPYIDEIKVTKSE